MNRALPPLVLLPGHMGTALDWQFQIPALAAGRPIHVPDRHHWLTSIPAMAQEIAAGLPETFDVVAWSMGGYIAFELYPLVRQRIRRLALLHTSARPESDEARVRRGELVRAIDTDGMAATFTRELTRSMVDPGQLDDAFRARLLSERLRLGRTAVVNQIAAMGARADARPALAAVACDTLVVAGRLDDITPLACAEEIVSALPRGELQVIERCGHCSPWDRAAAVNRVLQSFLG